MNELDLSPQDTPSNGRVGVASYRNWVLSIALIAVAGFLVFQAVNNASVFFLNVDEAVSDRSSLAGQRFRMQGQVLTEPAADSSDYRFVLGFADTQALVNHIGTEPTDLFACGQNVVVEGIWEGDEFTSQQILVKHSEEYSAEYPDRISETKDGCIAASDIDASIAELGF